MTNPKLNPPCTGWQEDLPPPNLAPTVPPTIWGNAPNHIDSYYLELSRVAFRARGLLLCMGLFLLTWLIVSNIGPVSFFHAEKASIFFAGLVSTIICFWIALAVVRLDISPPRDLPIRFNRARQRIYAYNFKYRWWNPFERWQVVPVAYDWSQVRAERWKKRGMTAQGAIIIKWGVVLSIVKPGTNDVIDRFPLSTMGADEFAWAYICTYMQQGPGALPPSELSRDHNDVPWYNLALRLAPKVRWPIEMDHESRTAP
ncbi:Uncharacterised protein [Serratia liquefaciens]|nr:Uncharacterised protein [Serratia liquefaciens]CAI1167873.1 Uncharacterised protein [Serratia liquefaciens]